MIIEIFEKGKWRRHREEVRFLNKDGVDDADDCVGIYTNTRMPCVGFHVLDGDEGYFRSVLPRT